MTPPFTDEHIETPVESPGGERLGTVTAVEGDSARVALRSGVVDSIMATVGWSDGETVTIHADDVREFGPDAIRLEADPTREADGSAPDRPDTTDDRSTETPDPASAVASPGAVSRDRASSDAEEWVDSAVDAEDRPGAPPATRDPPDSDAVIDEPMGGTRRAPEPPVPGAGDRQAGSTGVTDEPSGPGDGDDSSSNSRSERGRSSDPDADGATSGDRDRPPRADLDFSYAADAGSVPIPVTSRPADDRSVLEELADGPEGSLDVGAALAGDVASPSDGESRAGSVAESGSEPETDARGAPDPEGLVGGDPRSTPAAHDPERSVPPTVPISDASGDRPVTSPGSAVDAEAEGLVGGDPRSTPAAHDPDRSVPPTVPVAGDQSVARAVLGATEGAGVGDRGSERATSRSAGRRPWPGQRATDLGLEAQRSAVEATLLGPLVAQRRSLELLERVTRRYLSTTGSATDRGDGHDGAGTRGDSSK